MPCEAILSSGFFSISFPLMSVIPSYLPYSRVCTWTLTCLPSFPSPSRLPQEPGQVTKSWFRKTCPHLLPFIDRWMHFNSNSSPANDDLIGYLWNERIFHSTVHFAKKPLQTWKAEGKSWGRANQIWNFHRAYCFVGRQVCFSLEHLFGRGERCHNRHRHRKDQQWASDTAQLRENLQLGWSEGRRNFSVLLERLIPLKKSLCWQSAPCKLSFLVAYSQFVNEFFPLGPTFPSHIFNIFLHASIGRRFTLGSLFLLEPELPWCSTVEPSFNPPMCWLWLCSFW